MGAHGSKPFDSSTLKKRKKKHVKSPKSAPTGHQSPPPQRAASTGTSDPAPWELQGEPWDVILEEPVEKWRKSAVASHFGGFPMCQKKSPREGSPPGHWYSRACHDMSQDKSRSQIRYQPHGTPYKLQLNYDSNNLLQKTLNEGTLRHIIHSTGGFLALYFTYQSLEDRIYGIVPLFNLHQPELMYFHVAKPPPYEPLALSVSPDSTMLCLLLALPRGDQTLYEVQVYSRRPMAFQKSFHGPTFEFEYEVPGLRPNKGCPKIMFDPRYRSSRLGVVNIKSVQKSRVTHYFMVYDLRRKRPVTMPRDHYNSDLSDLDLLDASYSPDGAWVHVLIGHVTADDPERHTRRLLIVNSDTLAIVREIEIGLENLDLCYKHHLPAYSRCTRLMAVRRRKAVQVYRLPGARSLRALSRAVFLAYYTGDLNKLDVSQELRNYLQLKPYL